MAQTTKRSAARRAAVVISIFEESILLDFFDSSEIAFINKKLNFTIIILKLPTLIKSQAKTQTIVNSLMLFRRVDA